ncbi:PcfJ domain-containing protein [Rhizobium sp. BK176]|uniref:PcfJ domain-containing protein n=1 Tax=Rhizobium sp. BK176 TaxID=2587071 RepID=UPI002166C905|nr:PcfJ domain-containing protein [Rhizobium sp. BK176]MCS4089725.1 hypothetical protein [Rhizobium sp. BK176]
MFYDHQKTIVGNLLAKLTPDTAVQKLLAYSLGRVLLNQAKSTETAIDRQVLPEHEHIRDWLTAAVTNGEPWLKVVDEHGRPKKLMKFGSMDAITREADKAMMKFAQKSRGLRIADGDEELAHELDDGWYVVRLLTPSALDRESGEMQHCIGQGGYDTKVAGYEWAYYSLRDPFGKPHATMEVSMADGSNAQMQGKQNEEPLPEYIDRLAAFLIAMGWKPRQLSRTSRWVFDVDGRRHDITAMPDGVVLCSGISLIGLTVEFPRNLTVKGDLHIERCEITRMPDELTVAEVYRVRESTLVGTPRILRALQIYVGASECDAIADAVELGNSISIRRSSVSRLPKGLGSRNDLLIEGCQKLDDLTGLEAVRDLKLKTMPANVRLPDGLTVRSLEITETEFTSYPSSITVKQDVDIISAGLTELPEGLVVHGCLDVSGNPIKKLPEGLYVGGHFTFSKTGIETLPENLYVGASIIASNTPLRSLGTVREVWGRLSIDGTLVEKIPDGLHVHVELDASKSKLREIGKGVSVGGSLFISKTDVVELPGDIAIGRGLDASYSSLRALPDGFEANGELRLEGSDLRTLPEGFRARGDVNISETPITEFPDGVVIEGNLKCYGTRLRRVASDTVVRGDVLHPLGDQLFPRPMERMIANMSRNLGKKTGP